MIVLNRICLAFVLIFKWIFIQYLLLFFLLFFDKMILGNYGGGFYTWRTALGLMIPVCTFLFSFWYVLFPKKKQIQTFFFPYVLLMYLMFMLVASERDWNYKIITVDEYMLTGWLTPLFGALVHLLWFTVEPIDRFRNFEKRLRNSCEI